MRFFRRSARNDQLITCPSCCQLIAADARSCDMCGADLSELTAEQREARTTAPGALSGGGSPYAR